MACYRKAVDAGPLSEQESAAFFPQSVMSGDPRVSLDPTTQQYSGSVVLWVRVFDPERPADDLPLGLTLALDEAMTQLVSLGVEADALYAAATADHCMAVRVSGLAPASTYYYRFSYLALDGVARTRVGRTRTPPAGDADVPVTFGVLCCQDYVGKYFHVAEQLAAEDVDFVLHLGDYVYETTGDPSFQSPDAARSISFSAPEQALELGSGTSRYLAARSLSNYRDLYRQYRSDPALQALHERHPLIAIWDDHEFSDDCHGDVATYRDGEVDETEPERRAAADQAWFEYMPLDYADAPTAKLDPSRDFPDNFKIYRSFVFGRHLELVVTDLRRFRPDHLVPEDAAPGAICVDASAVAAQFAEPPGDLVPYVDLDVYANGAYQRVLRDNAEALAVAPASLSGNFSAVWINRALSTLSGVDLPEPIDLADSALARGYAYHSIGKSAQYSRLGARYVVAVRPFEALAAKRFRETDGKSELLMGQAQRDWFLATMSKSTRSFKLWASEICFQPRRIDLSDFPDAPADLRALLSISAEDWDGFPNERRALLEQLSQAGNVLILSGDLHAYFAGTPYVEGDEDKRVVELTTGSVSSSTWLDTIQGILSQSSSVPMDVKTLIALLPDLLRDTVHRPNPHLAFQELARNGYSVVEVGPDDVTLTIRTIASGDVATPRGKLRGELDARFDRQRFRMRAGAAELEMEVDGEFLTWSREEMKLT